MSSIFEPRLKKFPRALLFPFIQKCERSSRSETRDEERRKNCDELPPITAKVVLRGPDSARPDNRGTADKDRMKTRKFVVQESRLARRTVLNGRFQGDL